MRADDLLSRASRLWMRWQPVFVLLMIAFLAIGFKFQTPAEVLESLDRRILERDQEIESMRTQTRNIEALIGRVVMRLDRQDRLVCIKDARTAQAAGIPCQLLLNNGKEYEP